MAMKYYSEEFKNAVIQEYLSSEDVTMTDLATKYKICVSTISNWLRKIDGGEKRNKQRGWYPKETKHERFACTDMLSDKIPLNVKLNMIYDKLNTLERYIMLLTSSIDHVMFNIQNGCIDEEDKE
jgi:transposase-like protein